MIRKKRSLVLSVAIAGLLGGFAVWAGPAGAEQSGTAHADPTSTASGNATAVDGSVASGEATAIDDSTASGNAVAVHGSTASGCSLAKNGSTASGGADPCPLATAVRAPAPGPRHVVAPQARPRAAKLALTGSSNGPLLVSAALLVLIGANFLALAVPVRRRTNI